MNRSISHGALVVVATGALVTGGVAPAFADDTAGHHRETVAVVGNGTAAAIDDDSISAGKVRFDVSSTNPVAAAGGGSDVALFRLNEDKSLDDFFAGLTKEFSTDPTVAAQGTRDIKAAVTVRGLAQVVPDHPEVVTEFLDSGTYYLMDLGSVDTSAAQTTLLKPQLTTLTVTGHGGSHGRLRADLAVTTVDDTFRAPHTWPAKGSYTFTNESDTLHFMSITPVAAGTTDDDITAALNNPNATGQPAFFTGGPSGGNEVVSPGYRLKVDYDLPAGTYVLLCFIADEKTGSPHAMTGMHKVVVLE